MNKKSEIITLKHIIYFYYEILDMFNEGTHEYNETLSTINDYKTKLTKLRG